MTINTLVKRCSSCKEHLPVEHFHLNKSHSDGLASQCKACTKLSSRKHYEANKQAYFDRNQNVRRKQKSRVLEMKINNPCTDCGNKFHPFVMEFDHLEPATKKFSIGNLAGISNKQLSEELDKCELVCANCHKLRTFRRNQLKPRYVLAGID